MRDWQAWHEAYDADTPLRRRLELVQERIRETVAGRAEVRVLSLCCGEARDLVGALGGRGLRVTGRAVELDPTLAERARAGLAAGGLDVEVVCGDAALAEHYAGAAPADLVLACGVFGNISDSDVRATVAALPALCAEGGHVIWTRHRNAPDLTPAIRAWLDEEGFEEVAFDAPGDAHFTVGVHRSRRAAVPLDPRARFFHFVGYDALGRVAVREAAPDDVEALLGLYRELADGRTDAEPADRAHAREVVVAALADPLRHLLVAELEGAIVGTVDVLIVPNLTHGGRPWAVVENVVVARTARRGGVGRALFAHAYALAQESGCYKVQLLSAKGRDVAHSFYESVGLEPVAEGFKRYFE